MTTIVLIEPHLCTAEGHEYDHVIELAKAARQAYPKSHITVLSGPQDEFLTEQLNQQDSIDHHTACFPRHWVSDKYAFVFLARVAWVDGWRLAGWIRQNVSRKETPVFLFTSIAIYHILTLATVRLLLPFRTIHATGIFRYDPLGKDGKLIRKYSFLRTNPIGRIAWRKGLKDTIIYTDSAPLRDVLEQHLKIKARTAPMALPGVWTLLESDWHPETNSPPIVGYIGQPRLARGFQEFMLTAMSMEQSRVEGRIAFRAVTSPKSLEMWKTDSFRPLFESGLKGLELREKWMTSDQFAAEMAEFDIVWALGDEDYYRRQTSGIVGHALALGSKIITNRNGWAESVCGNSPKVALTHLSSKAAVEGLEYLLDVSTVDSGADLADWRKCHSRKAFEAYVAEAIALSCPEQD